MFTNYDVGHLVFNSVITSGEVEQPAVMEPGEDERVLTNGEISALAHQLVYPLTGAKQEPDPATSTTGINDMACLPEQCASRCGDAVGLGQVVWAVLDSETPAASAGAILGTILIACLAVARTTDRRTDTYVYNTKTQKWEEAS